MGIVHEIINGVGLFSSSGLFGGITGVIGNELKSRREIKLLKIKAEMEQAAWPERQKEREHALAMREGNFAHELKLFDLNREKAIEDAERELVTSETEFSGRALIAALKADALSVNVPTWVVSVRSLTRPVTLGILLFLTALIFMSSGPEIRTTIAAAVVYMASVAVLFYYGDRPSSGMRKMLLTPHGEAR